MPFVWEKFRTRMVKTSKNRKSFNRVDMEERQEVFHPLAFGQKPVPFYVERPPGKTGARARPSVSLVLSEVARTLLASARGDYRRRRPVPSRGPGQRAGAAPAMA